MRKPWKAGIILLLLVSAAVFRWNYVATNTIEQSVVNWKVDRWTGQGWIEKYNTTSNQLEIEEIPISVVKEKPMDNSAPGTIIQKAAESLGIYLNDTDPQSKVTQTKEEAWRVRNNWTKGWQYAVGIVTLWLILFTRSGVQRKGINR